MTFCTVSQCISAGYNNDAAFSYIHKVNHDEIKPVYRDFGHVDDILGSRIHNRNLQNVKPSEVFNFQKDSNNYQHNKVTSLLKLNDINRSANVKNRRTGKYKTLLKESKEEYHSNLTDTKSSDSHQTKKLPNAIIIGVKKCGTRALLEFLRVHPDVRATGPEPHFFDKHYEEGLEWYRQKMPLSNDAQITIEKTPSYFVTKEVARRVLNMSKDVKLIVVVRDPVTRAISDYAQVASKRKDLKPFEAMAFVDNSTTVVDTTWTVIKIGVYSKHMQKWLRYFPLEQFHFVSGENLIANPGEELEKVQQFLGLSTVVTNKNFVFNGSRGFPCIKKNLKSKRVHCLDGTKGRKHPHVNPIAIKRLRDFYRPFNAKFYQMVGKDFHWL